MLANRHMLIATILTIHIFAKSKNDWFT